MSNATACMFGLKLLKIWRKMIKLNTIMRNIIKGRVQKKRVKRVTSYKKVGWVGPQNQE